MNVILCYNGEPIVIPILLTLFGIYIQFFTPDVITVTHHQAEAAYDTYTHSKDAGGVFISVGVLGMIFGWVSAVVAVDEWKL